MEIVVDDPVELRKRQRRIRLILVGLVLAGIAWAFAIVYSITADSPEALTDEQRDVIAVACADASAALRALPELDRSDARNAVALGRAENDIFVPMVEHFRVLDVDGDPGVALRKWVDDWDTVLARRTEYIVELDATGTGRFESPLDTVLRIGTYAESQGLDDCTPEVLQPDVLDRPREYPALAD